MAGAGKSESVKFEALNKVNTYQKFKDWALQISTFDRLNNVKAGVCLHVDWMSPEETASEADSVFQEYIQREEAAGVMITGKVYLVLVPIWASQVVCATVCPLIWGVG